MSIAVRVERPQTLDSKHPGNCRPGGKPDSHRSPATPRVPTADLNHRRGQTQPLWQSISITAPVCICNLHSRLVCETVQCSQHYQQSPTTNIWTSTPQRDFTPGRDKFILAVHKNENLHPFFIEIDAATVNHPSGRQCLSSREDGWGMSLAQTRFTTYERYQLHQEVAPRFGRAGESAEGSAHLSPG